MDISEGRINKDEILKNPKKQKAKKPVSSFWKGSKCKSDVEPTPAVSCVSSGQSGSFFIWRDQVAGPCKVECCTNKVFVLNIKEVAVMWEESAFCNQKESMYLHS